MRTFVALVLLLSVAQESAHAAPWRGRVVRVNSGDTITVSQDGRRFKVELHGVACPRKRQPFADNAKHFTRKLLDGKDVTVEPVTEAKGRRVVARVTVVRTEYIEVMRGNRISQRRVKVHVVANEELVKVGLAWHRRDAGVDKRLVTLENTAKKTKRGLWAQPNPTPPWEWRKR